MSPSNANETQKTPDPLYATRSGLDLDSRSEVALAKTQAFTPVTTADEFTARLGGDSIRILEVMNDGLRSFETEKMLADSTIPWYKLTEEGEIELDEHKNPVQFSGTLLVGEKAKSFAATVLNFAKAAFGYPSEKLPKGSTKEQQDAYRKLKQTAKDAAQDALLSSAATVEALKK